MRRARFACVLVAAVLMPAGTAHAMIQIDRGIAGARIGNTPAEVRAALGTPSSITRGTNEFGPWLNYRFTGGIRVMFQGRRQVTAVSTTGRGDRTSRGVGVGSSEASVRSRVPGVKCETFETIRICHTGDFAPGRRVTDFRIKGGKVTSVGVGIVID
jgi:hypothetical protein